VVVQSVREQEEMAAELEAWGEEALLIPEVHRGGEGVRPDSDLEAEWLGSLARLVGQPKPRLVIVTEGVLRAKQPHPDTIRKGLWRIETGTVLDPLQFVEDIVLAGYRKVGTVTERGEVARRGGIVDVFSTQSCAPVRMEWEGIVWNRFGRSTCMSR
jgi:transcription-repair coupling factor (superfamily II helicase)